MVQSNHLYIEDEEEVMAAMTEKELGAYRGWLRHKADAERRIAEARREMRYLRHITRKRMRKAKSDA